MKEEVRNILVGMVTLVVLVFAAGLSFSSSKIEAPTGVTIIAEFSQIDGLTVGNEVRMSGIKIGEVTKLSLGGNFTAVVDLRIDAAIQIPEDTAAKILTDGLFGSKHVMLDPGGSEDYFKTGDKFEVTQDSVVVQDLLDQIIGEAKSNRAKRNMSK